jgi:hypothetical protein
MSDEEKTREQIIDIVNNEEPVNDEPVKEEVNEEVKEVKPKAKRASRAKVKIVKESVVSEPVVEVVEEKPVEPVIEEKPKKIDKLKEIVKCPDCNMDMTVHTLKYIHKRRGFCKAEVVPEKTPEPIVQQQPKPKPITEDTVNDYIKQNPDVVTNYLRNERILKAQRKQSHARNLLNNAF